ncbi:thioredoxin domain-containing protein [Sunxiuqinia indica]|uniref:thioredoxin domain-containing protein n=1 Tax=Sunxiuqinia indica TaxID=2692584 RepID=UPI0013594E02|nr:thioredoxin domain-containing protein [Sunxiuqinia indica]
MKKHQYTNQLIHETSPYLLQHARNPVNWMPWGDEALEKAKKENKLLLISIGYAACHWCHVMEHESFEDTAIAQVMNDYFVCIKVDREERPDIDQIYMTAVQLMTQRGGWPLNVIALPDGRPFWGGTYFMKDVWMNTLLQVHNFHQENPDKTVEYAERLKQGISDSNLIPISKEGQDITIEHLKQAVQHWQSNLDYQEGGSAGAPKFMMPNNLSFLLRWAHQANDADILEYVETTLSKMAMGGIYDQVGGGFARYSTDANWKVPHFEKMLYDNGQLLSVYAQAFKKTKNPLYAEVINQTIDFLKREMRSPEHGFYSSLDADSEGEEGKFYVWKKQELQQLLKDEFELFSKYYNINATGYWEDGNYILLRRHTDETFANENMLSLSDLKDKVKSWQTTLLKERESRIRPGLDDKILSSWNALAISGLVDSHQALGNTEFLELAEKNMQFLKEKQMSSDGTLKHSYKNDISKIDGFLEDYALMIQALLDLVETTGNIPYLEDAKLLMNKTFEQFYDSEKSIFYFTPKSQTDVINRSIEVHDNVIPASNSVMANNLIRLGHLTANQDYLKIAERTVSKMIDDFKNYPGGYSNWLHVALDFTDKHFEVVIAGEDAIEKLKKLQENYLPNCLFCAGTTDKQLPLLENRIVNGKTLIYICQNNTCQLPVESTKEALQITATNE